MSCHLDNGVLFTFGMYSVADLGGVLWVQHPPSNFLIYKMYKLLLICINPWPIAYVATMRNKSNV